MHEAEFELVCVSAIESKFESARLENLRSLGFPIRRVIATYNLAGAISPKATTLSLLSLVAFVDDFLPYHRGVPPTIHRTLITRETNGTPNVGAELDNVDSNHRNLLLFSDWWLESLPTLSS